MADIISIDPETDKRWSSYIAEDAGATVFHDSEWIGTLRDTYGYENRSLAVVENTSLVGILPMLEVRSWITGHRGVCLPFTDECSPLGKADFGASLIAECLRMQKERDWKYFEIRGGLMITGQQPAILFKSHMLTLTTDFEALCKTFKRTHLQHVHKAQQAGVIIEHRNDKEAVDEFMRLHTLTRRKLGVPPQPDIFFRNLHSRFSRTNRFEIWLASHQSRVIAASLFLLFKDMLFYKFSASDPSYLHYSPNHGIVWDIIRWGCTNGYRKLDFGRTDPDNSGLLQYKRGWAPAERDVIYYRFPCRETMKTHSSQYSTKLAPVLKMLPLSILKIIGSLLYRHAE